MDEKYCTSFEKSVLSGLLISISILCLSAEIGVMVLFDCGVWDRVRGAKEEKIKPTSVR